MSSPYTRPGPPLRGLVLRACAVGVAGALPGVAAVASTPTRPSVEGFLLYVAVTASVLVAVPALAASGALTGLVRGALAGVLPRARVGAAVDGPRAAVLGRATGVFRGTRGLGGLLDDLRHRLARRGPPAAGGSYAI